MSDYILPKNSASDHIGYKKLQTGNGKICLIAELIIRGEHNENRPSVAIKKTAKHRCSEAFINKIYHMDTKEEVLKGYSLWDESFEYIAGKTVKANDFDKNLEKVCSGGIHYFLSEEVAYYYTLDKRFNENKNGLYKSFHHNGQPFIICTYKNGKKNGLYKLWHNNGKLCIICNYIDNEYDGECKEYLDNGKIWIVRTYANGVRIQ